MNTFPQEKAEASSADRKVAKLWFLLLGDLPVAADVHFAKLKASAVVPATQKKVLSWEASLGVLYHARKKNPTSWGPEAAF